MFRTLREATQQIGILTAPEREPPLRVRQFPTAGDPPTGLDSPNFLVLWGS